MRMQETAGKKKDISMSYMRRDWEMRCSTREPGTDLA